MKAPLLSAILITLGVTLGCVNFYLSWIAAPLFRFRHGRYPDRIPSGVPLVGTILLLIVALGEWQPWIWWLVVIFQIIDTGSAAWLVGVMLLAFVKRA